MRKSILIAIGLLLFAVGVAVGVLWTRSAQDRRNAKPETDEAAAGVRNKTKQPSSSLEDDATKLNGLWYRAEQGLTYCSVLLRIREESSGQMLSWHQLSPSPKAEGFRFVLREQDGERLLLVTEGEDVYFQYRLEEDRLHITLVPDQSEESLEWGLTLDWRLIVGEWQRTK